MGYSGKYINVSRSELLVALEQKITPKRFQHVLRVEKTAIEIANCNGVDLEKASIAALLHDYAKDYPLEEMERLAKARWNPEGMSQAGENIWHGFAAATIAQKEFGVNDEDILSAIAAHTIGWNVMSPLVNVIFIADYIEPGRRFPGVEEARELANKNLELAVGYKMKSTIKHLVEEEKKLFLPTVEFYNNWLLRRNL